MVSRSVLVGERNGRAINHWEMCCDEDTKRPWLAGVDGCRAGWVVVFLRPDGDEVRVRTIQRFADVLSAVEAPAVVAIDIPIGLPDRVGPEGRGPVSLPVSPCYLFLEKSM